MVDAPIFLFLYDRIVPLPLHIFLGLGNQLVQLVQDELEEGDDEVDFAVFVASCKATPADIYGAEKRSAAQTLNGGELKRIIHSPEFSDFIEHVADEEISVFLFVLLEALLQVSRFLLSPERLTRREVSDFTRLVIFIGDVWHRNNDVVKPKVHMLSHCAEFARQHRGLGAYNESPIESSHHDVHLTFERHSNCGCNTPLKERRAQSDIAQRRVSRVDSGRINPPPRPRLCPLCGHPSAKYLNHGQPHPCMAANN